MLNINEASVTIMSHTKHKPFFVKGERFFRAVSTTKNMERLFLTTSFNSRFSFMWLDDAQKFEAYNPSLLFGLDTRGQRDIYSEFNPNFLNGIKNTARFNYV